jgi:outer membrane protein assembly complex protein YaeT
LRRSRLSLTKLFAFTALASIGLLGAPLRSTQAGPKSDPATDASATPKVVIDQAEIEGVTALAPEAVEAAVEIGSGEVLDRAKVSRTVENLRERYREIGYEQATVESRLVRRLNASGKQIYVIVMKVTEGNPTRLLGISFALQGEGQGAEGINQPSSVPDLGYSTWRGLEGELDSKASVKPGEVLTQERIAAIRRAIQDVFVSDEYIGARVDNFQVVSAPAPSPSKGAEAADLNSLPTGRWVRITALIRPGERVSFGFRGNIAINKSRLDSIVDEQRGLGLGKDYVQAIQKRIEDEYKSLGYAKVAIKSYTFEHAPTGPKDARSRHVTYDIDEGPRVTILAMRFEGNSSFTEAQLLDRFQRVAPLIVQRGYYVEKDVQHGLDLTIEWMKSQGFLGAKLTTVSSNYPFRPISEETGTTIQLTVYLYEGDQTVVRNVATSGAKLFDTDAVAKFLGVKEGEPLNLFALSEGIQALKTAYRAKGYLSVAVTNENTDRLVKYSDENRLADISIDISEGPQYRLSRIDIEGREKTDAKVILRECPLKVGDVVEEPRLAETETNLRRLGLFSLARVRAVPDPDAPDKRIIKINVEEAPPGVVAGGPGFRNDLGPRAFAELGYTNLWGENHGIFLDLAVNRRLDDASPPFHFVEYQTQLAYNWPWFANTDITFRPTVNLSGTQYTNFDAVVSELALNWEKKILKNPNLIGVFTYSLERVNQFNAVNGQDDGDFRIGSITPSLRLDMRDNPLAPTSGFYATTSFEWADPIFLSQIGPSPIGYTRFQFRADYMLPLFPGATWLFSFRTGLERSTASNANSSLSGYGSIPLIKRFALGGISSLRGYEEQELNLNNYPYLVGTASYVNYRTQIDFPVAGSLKFGPFLDAANLQVDGFQFGNLLFGAGFGIRYLTPIGPVSLDYGWKLNPPLNSPVDTDPSSNHNFYFSVGMI